MEWNEWIQAWQQKNHWSGLDHAYSETPFSGPTQPPIWGPLSSRLRLSAPRSDELMLEGVRRHWPEPEATFWRMELAENANRRRASCRFEPAMKVREGRPTTETRDALTQQVGTRWRLTASGPFDGRSWPGLEARRITILLCHIQWVGGKYGTPLQGSWQYSWW